MYEGSRKAEIEQLIEELAAKDREAESAHRAVVRTGNAEAAGRTAAQWSMTRFELIAAQRELRAITG